MKMLKFSYLFICLGFYIAIANNHKKLLRSEYPQEIIGPDSDPTLRGVNLI